MNEIEIREFIEIAKRNIALLFSGNDSNLHTELINYFNSKVKIVFNEQSRNANFAAHTGSSLIHDFNNNELSVQNVNITVGLYNPPDRNTLQFNGWMVDVYHELFHAFTKIMMGIKKCESKGTIYYAPAGGKISLLKYIGNNKFDNVGDVPSSVLFNELVTDLMAYICVYKSADAIIRNNYLETIDVRYGHYNGYYELLQLGLVIFNSFTNYPVNYDNLLSNGKEIFSCKYPRNETIYYNDLMYGVGLNPFYIKDQFMKYSSESDYEELNKASFAILRDFENKRNNKNERIINVNEIKKLMTILKKYFDNKIQSMEETNDFSQNIIEQLKENFNQRYDYVKNYYGISVEESIGSRFGM